MSNANMNTNQTRKLPFNYAQIMLPSGLCVACFTSTDEITGDDLFAFIPVPRASNDYGDKYYDFDTDLWYLDEAHTIEATEVNEMYHG